MQRDRKVSLYSVFFRKNEFHSPKIAHSLNRIKNCASAYNISDLFTDNERLLDLSLSPFAYSPEFDIKNPFGNDRALITKLENTWHPAPIYVYTRIYIQRAAENAIPLLLLLLLNSISNNNNE